MAESQLRIGFTDRAKVAQVELRQPVNIDQVSVVCEQMHAAPSSRMNGCVFRRLIDPLVATRR